MFVTRVYIFICYLTILFIETTTSSSSCIYDVGRGQKLDIRTLGFATGKRPKYDEIPNITPGRPNLSWNGCFAYSKSDGGTCKNAAACFTDKVTGKSTVIAKQSDAKFEPEDNINLLIYHTNTMLLTVYLTCYDNDEDTYNARQDSSTIFNIYIQSRCCCPGKCHFSAASSSLSGGAVFIILLISILFIYIVGGVGFLKYGRGATGVDLIPNRVTWLLIALYASYGLRYSLQVIRRRSLNVDYQTV